MTLELFKKIIEEYVEKKRNNPYFNCNYKRPLKIKQILKRL